ncbi:preprotein translocase subunit SecY [Rosenbergiella epipactidis]|uniref:Protein translocase subunit SecY n=3 Tax=Rosenbergiella TaxID=1356488 RepID=A0A1H9MUT6_9GAMM|nr:MULTISPECIES: preprotein translocase subunit SecY [Erwiniaceae]KMV71166.1 preprotein translocase subunit SecY [bacteria symbiont BFo2 of Frankliniella occidentalis]QGX90295.1 preprotein translocase subunit SecY [Tatumella sp. TA1]KYP93301.1 preprotein translocase subunit SecY [bacteria symbiont BFo2 of Frankliniella occidentalis]KYP95563.1 preprotein translocase subunit SecY [bacteria symbiont BFo2 of Frankliniella occidentalis]MBT0719609.1 preprotein translocase subunit SecY [Rosenbergiell
MAKQPGLDFQSAKGGLGELKRRLMFVIGALIVFRIGSFIPIPGIDATVLAKLLEQQRGTIIDMFNMFSGGALSRASIFALGIMPYISASIIIQLLTVVHPALAEIKKEGESGRRKISQYTRYGTLVLAVFQAIGIATGLPNMPGMQGLVINPGIAFYVTAVVSLVTGTMFLMWLGEQITERGIGNGISIIIFAGIVAGLPQAVGHTIEQARQGGLHFLLLLLVAVLVFAVTYFVIFVERGQRRIVVNYAKRQQGRRVYAAQSTHLPLKVNMAGVIPAIFASSIILFPATLTSWFGGSTGWSWLSAISDNLAPGQPLYVLLYATAIIFFCFFYTALVFNPRETADNLKKSGAFVPGIRPGEQTARYIDKVMTRLTLIGALYITFICLIPEFMRDAMNVPFSFGGTSLLIVVVVIMDFMAQVQTLMMSSQYESALKKANLKGQGR